ncbi:hypothetical protein MNV49_002508 [Pseudohyphozyma bogoriensis]|nr:hypothetical protein MNV49_002508 [Pseudohyphozyma bogoriensis]
MLSAKAALSPLDALFLDPAFTSSLDSLDKPLPGSSPPVQPPPSLLALRQQAPTHGQRSPGPGPSPSSRAHSPFALPHTASPASTPPTSAASSPVRPPRKDSLPVPSSSLASPASASSSSRTHLWNRSTTASPDTALASPPPATQSNGMHGDGEHEAETTVWAGGDASLSGARGTSINTSTSPTSSSTRRARSDSTATKKANPLQDLLRSERLYVEDLSCIIKKVAGAWSRRNFPPKELDSMFRAIEGVYRNNKALLAKLDEIGPNPSSPKALGDLLMRLVPDLEPSYTRYATTYSTHFNYFPPISSNPLLPPILSALSWPSTLDPSLRPDEPVTVDLLFTLPMKRLAYYKSLYLKLLSSTKEGKSDHSQLVQANETLDRLLGMCDDAKARVVEGAVLPNDTREEPGERSSGESDWKRRESPGSSDRFSATTGTSAATSITLLSNPPRIEDLERRLTTERVLDIFTMQPKKCKLQIAPPNLPFTRHLRRSGEASFSFTPSSASTREVYFQHAYIFLLTDLFLICERMSPSDRNDRINPDGSSPDMWLLYPPLAGKHLRVGEGRRDGEFVVEVMRKERLFVDVRDPEVALEWRKAFEEASSFGTNQGLMARSESSASTRSPISGSRSSTGLPSPHIRGSSPSSSPFPTSPHTSQSPEPPFQPQMPQQTGSYRRPPRDAGPGGSNFAGPPTPISPSASYPTFSTQAGLPPRRHMSGGAGPPANGNGPEGAYRPPPRKASMGPAQEYANHSVPLPPPPITLRDDLPPPPISPGLPPTPGHNQYYGDQNVHPEQQVGRNFYPPPPPSSDDFDSRSNSRSNSPHSLQQHQQRSQSPYSSSQRSQSPYAMSPSGNIHQQQFPQPNYPPLPPHPGFNSGLSKSPSSRSYGSYTSGRTDRSSGYPEPPPPMPDGRHGGGSYGQGYSTLPTSRRTDPGFSTGHLTPGGSIHRSRSADGFEDGHYRAPSETFDRSHSAPEGGYDGDSPPASPVKPTGPQKTVVAAQMKCKAFLQQGFSQWKSLGTARLKLFVTLPMNQKQIVVESDKKPFISTIILTDGVERIGKTGVAIELSDEGKRTGIVYLLQLRTEEAAVGLFDQLIAGSDRERGGKARS